MMNTKTVVRLAYDVPNTETVILRMEWNIMSGVGNENTGEEDDVMRNGDHFYDFE